ncbi:hypothetical protein CCACVL1_06702, partial [Corchorus capsularis]
MQRILSRNNNERSTILCSSLTEGHETALHIAVGARQVAIVREFVRRMKPEDLELQDILGNTAFCIAVATGSVKIAKILISKGIHKNIEVELIRGADNKTPLYIAAIAGHPEMVRFAYEYFKQHIADHHLEQDEERDIFFACIHAGLFGRGFNTISFQNKAQELTKLLCKTMSSDESKSLKDTVDRVSELLFEAAKLGNHKFLDVLISFYPDLIFRKDEHYKSIFHIAVLHRHASIFKHIHNLGLQKDVIVLYTVDYLDEENGNTLYNMLHLAAKLPPLDRLSIVSGSALQFQRELLWFKEVENLTRPVEIEKKDSRDKLTPRQLFTKEHEQLRKDGEKWMKSTAQSSMIVATLITTVVFTTASSLPGGNKDKDGSPNDKDKALFHVFMVADAVAMCSSIISTLMFLSILTSRYAEEDFLFRLPMKLAAGLTSLLLSMLALM